MGNLQSGTMIKDEKDYKILYQDGHVVQYNRNFVDGRPTNTWRFEADFGTPQDASRSLPGLVPEIYRAAKAV